MLLKLRKLKIPKEISKEFICDHIKNNITNLKEITKDIYEKIDGLLELKIVVGYTEFNRIIKSLFHPNVLNTQFWIDRGWDNPEEQVKKTQRERSPRCIDYWMKRGSTLEDAKTIIRRTQKELSQKRKEKYKDNMQIFNKYSVKNLQDRGFSLEESIFIVEQRKKQTSISGSREYLKHIKGKTDEEIDISNKKKGRCGIANWQTGKTPSLGAGAGVSGTLFHNEEKYYFRSLLELSFIYERLEKNEQIIQCDIPKQQSPYRFCLSDGSIYTPDFLINNIFFEIKNQWAISKFIDVSEKYELILEYIRKNNLRLVILSDIPVDINRINCDYENGLIEFASQKKEEKFKRMVENAKNNIDKTITLY